MVERKCLVIGASGMLGRRVTAGLLARGARVLATGRNPDKLAEARAAGAEVAMLDLTQPDGFEATLSGIDTMFTAAHGLMDRSGHGAEWIDEEGMCRLIDAAIAAGVRRFVHTSAQDAAPDSPAAFTRAKHAAERHLRASGLDWTILRPAAFADLYAQAMIGDRVIAGKTVWLLGPGTTRRNLVAVDDVVAIALRALIDGGFSRETVEVTGPDNLTEREVAALYSRLSGRAARVRSIRVGLARRLGRLLRPIHGGPHSLLSFLTAQDGRDELVADGTGMAERLGRLPIRVETLARERLGDRISPGG